MEPDTSRSDASEQPSTAVQRVIPENVLFKLDIYQNKSCMFCNHKEISELLYGKLYQLNDVIVHHFCLLLSSKSVKNGYDNEGILGFLFEDIVSELQRGATETCFYCKKKGATIACCGEKCRKVFHLPCGLENGSMHQYYKAYKSFCGQHRAIQNVDLAEFKNTSVVQCAICKDDVIPSPSPSSIWAPCCKRNAWFHRNCIQELALSTGYFLKCPLCYNVNIFMIRMLRQGIYIPSRYSTCKASTCLCPHPESRNYSNEGGSWEIILCHSCGSNGTHRLCNSIKPDQEWFCPACHACKAVAGIDLTSYDENDNN